MATKYQLARWKISMWLEHEWWGTLEDLARLFHLKIADYFWIMYQEVGMGGMPLKYTKKEK